ncbi:MAG: AMP-binding protein [Pseudomonadota bacterium]
MPQLHHLLSRAATAFGQRPAIALGNQMLMTYQELVRSADGLATGLIDHFDLTPGDRVAMILPNTPEYIVALGACWRAGLIPVPMNAKLHAREFAYMLDHAGASVLLYGPGTEAAAIAAGQEADSALIALNVADGAFAALCKTEPAPRHAPPQPNDPAWLFYTSGTTGRPKGATLTHANLVAMATSYFVDIDQIAPTDSIIHAAPLSHGSGLYIVPHIMAGAVQVIPESGGFSPGEIHALVGHWPGATMFAAPTMVNRLVRDPATAAADLTNLKTIVYGGAPMHVADVEVALDTLGPKLAQLYGQGESPMCITGLSRRWYADRAHPRWREIIGSAGFPQSVVEVAVRDAEGNSLPAGEAGEICARGAPVMRGYWHDEAATADAIRDGWLHTGDVGVLDREGFLTLLDRSKDLIISGGSNIYPREVEEVLLRHDDVAEVSVVGAPHADWGEEVVAFVVGRDPGQLDTEALDARCREHIARFKRPKRYIQLNELPRSAYGKILKRELRARLNAGSDPSD